MFDSLLIANRGEIACRIIATARQLGLRTVAVYSEADRTSRHVRLADEALLIGPASASDSYLCIERIVAAARRSQVQAIHPGYGFLAENADFTRACDQAGLIFVGPPASAIAAMGNKAEAKQLMARAGVPLVPGYHGENQDQGQLAAEAEKIGYPLLLKASAGGGGKGMRLVETSGDFPASLDAARREARNAFGDERMLLERYLLQPRHVEIQVFADSSGECIHLFERDCSIQRRHQKVIEEAPAPGVSESLRRQMTEAAIAAARAISYVGAGTVEFLLDADERFYFMEMNTRLQVEHPVTELITGQDLVEWQLRVACGEPLPCSQQQLNISGHAIEARLYAEDPRQEFLPSSGRLVHLRFPEQEPGVRVDSGIDVGEQVSIHYDPLLAKLIAHGIDREQALSRLKRALDATEVVGLSSNRNFLRQICRHPDFAWGAYSTDFIPCHKNELLPEKGPATTEQFALVALFLLLRQRHQAVVSAEQSADPASPWHATCGWRLNGDNHHRLLFRDGDTDYSVLLHYRSQGVSIELEEKELYASGELTGPNNLEAEIAGHRYRCRVIRNDSRLTLFHNGASRVLQLVDPLAQGIESSGEAGTLCAPMPGKIIAILVQPGEWVKPGTSLLILEAMKMEHSIKAPRGGIIGDINFQVGQMVEEGAELLAMSCEDD